ncbi:MAG: hypothetical protein GTN73_05235 [Candidatus Aminicenantes bacterium]|nr:hypothetical protein [Candidatus Aminicenantes bacterium]
MVVIEGLIFLFVFLMAGLIVFFLGVLALMIIAMPIIGPLVLLILVGTRIGCGLFSWGRKPKDRSKLKSLWNYFGEWFEKWEWNWVVIAVLYAIPLSIVVIIIATLISFLLGDLELLNDEFFQGWTFAENFPLSLLALPALSTLLMLVLIRGLAVAYALTFILGVYFFYKKGEGVRGIWDVLESVALIWTASVFMVVVLPCFSCAATEIIAEFYYALY